jgi:hypothetical protein
MSYTSLAAQTLDQDLRDRINAAIRQEALVNPDQAGAAGIITGQSVPLDGFVWAVSTDTEAAYASALAAGVPDPGLDPAVISDSMILSAVQAHWDEVNPP